MQTTEKWTQLFYKNTEDAVAVDESTREMSFIPDTGCLWFPSVFKINKERLYTRCGPDASHYLSFQKQLIILFICVTIVSLCIILPINFQGSLQGDKKNFGHTTISNLDPRSNWIWVHIIASFLFVPLTVLIMRKSSGRAPIVTTISSRTLMVTHISKNHRNTEDIKSYFNVRFPTVEIKDIQIAYKVKKLMDYELQREKVHEARMYCLTHESPTNKIQVRPEGCIVCCPWKTTDALQYYTLEEERLTNLVINERRTALNSPLGIAFITVDSEESAQHVVRNFEPGTVRHWNIVIAPSPSDINWQNLEISYRHWYIKAVLINSLLFFVLFFLTTPVIVVNIFNNLTQAQDNIFRKISPLISEFIPTLLLLSLSALMPVIVAYSDQWMTHWTKSKQNHATMYKTFFFLLFMVLILPSLGLTSAQAFVQWSIHPNNKTLGWKCIFLADKGAFFVNYVITSALIGTALELLRFPELAMYVWRLLLLKSVAEKVTIRKEILSEFPFGIHYAWTLLIFTVCTVYSLTCPLITPFGLLYLFLKHYVDKYNIYYVYRPITMSGEGQQIHADAVRMVRTAIILLQSIMTAFAFVRGGVNLMVVISFIGFLTTLGFFFFVSPFPSCRSPPVNMNRPEIVEQYVAPVLLTSQVIDAEAAPLHYGSSNESQIDIVSVSNA